MPLDPKQLAEWKATHAECADVLRAEGDAPPGLAMLGFVAVPTLIAEVERLQIPMTLDPTKVAELHGRAVTVADLASLARGADATLNLAVAMRDGRPTVTIDPANGMFYEAARQAVPVLIAELERLREVESAAKVVAASLEHETLHVGTHVAVEQLLAKIEGRDPVDPDEVEPR